MEKEEKTLSEEDRKRIEQEAKKFAAFIGNKDGTAEFDYYMGAEYEHKYQREQQAELRNKVIDECIAMICSTAPEYGPIKIGVKMVHELLNSLKK